MRIEGKSGKKLKDATGMHGVNSRDMFVEGMGNSSVWLPPVGNGESKKRLYIDGQYTRQTTEEKRREDAAMSGCGG